MSEAHQRRGLSAKEPAVPHLILATVFRFARENGYEDALLSRAPPESERRRWPNTHVPWSEAVELFEALERLHEGVLGSFAAYYVTHFPLIRWLSTYVQSPHRLLRIMVFAWNRVWPMTFHHQKATHGATIRGELPRELRSAATLFRLSGEIARQIPTIYGSKPARVAAQVGTHHCILDVHIESAQEDPGACAEDDELLREMVLDVANYVVPPEVPAHWQLTPAETRVAHSLAEGKSVRDIAALLGISSETVRTHLKRIMAKASVRRQSELMRQILGGR